jgi:hypothetical protein
MEIKNKIFEGERSLFSSCGLKIYDCTFQNGESPLKESKDIYLKGSNFKWKYPLWYSNDVLVEESKLDVTARSGIWYTHNITINAIDLFIVKLDGSEVELPSKFDDFTGKGNIYYSECSMEAKNNRDLLIRLANENGLIVHKDEWWHFYDERLKNYGMGYNYINSKFLPKMEEEVFSIVKE